MQKKFLRTSVLTLVAGLSLLATSHAMAPDAETDHTARARLNGRIQTYIKESDICVENYYKMPDDGGYIGASSSVGLYSGIPHIREAGVKGRTAFRGKGGVNLGGPDCSGCKTLDTTVNAMLRDGKVYDARDFQ